MFLNKNWRFPQAFPQESPEQSFTSLQNEDRHSTIVSRSAENQYTNKDISRDGSNS